MEETAQNFEKRFFYKQIIDFHCPSKILSHTSKLYNFFKITGPYCRPISSGVTSSQSLYNFISLPKNYTFYKNFFIISEAEQKQIVYIRSSSSLPHRKICQLSTGDPLELLEADEVLDPVNGGGLQDLVPCELTHSLCGLLALLLGLADPDELVALAQEGRHALASVIGRHVERFSALQRKKAYCRRNAKFGSLVFFSPRRDEWKGIQKWQSISQLRQFSRDVCAIHLNKHQEQKTKERFSFQPCLKVHVWTQRKGGRGGGRLSIRLMAITVPLLCKKEVVRPRGGGGQWGEGVGQCDPVYKAILKVANITILGETPVLIWTLHTPPNIGIKIGVYFGVVDQDTVGSVTFSRINVFGKKSFRIRTAPDPKWILCKNYSEKLKNLTIFSTKMLNLKT